MNASENSGVEHVRRSQFVTLLLLYTPSNIRSTPLLLAGSLLFGYDESYVGPIHS